MQGCSCLRSINAKAGNCVEKGFFEVISAAELIACAKRSESILSNKACGCAENVISADNVTSF